VPQATLAAVAGDHALAATRLRALVERHATAQLPEPHFRQVICACMIAQRETFQVTLPRSTLDRAGKLTIVLLHPDGVSAASMAQPLDERMLSVTLHGPTLLAQ
jgi:hypothetical protein